MEGINMNVFRQLRDKRRAMQDGTKRSASNFVTSTKNNLAKKTVVQEKPIVSDIQTGMDQLQLDNRKVTVKQNKPVSLNMLNGNTKIVSNTMKKNNTLVTKYNTGDTIVSGVIRDKNNPNNAELHQYRIKKQSAEEPDFDNLPVPSLNKKQPVDFEMKDVFVNTIKNNKLTKGTRIMMDNEVIHAKEAMESGIYVLWTSKSVNIKFNSRKWVK
jgi:hypothetical protein